MKTTSLLILLAIGFVFTASAQVDSGDKSPQFSALDDSGKLWNSDDYVGKRF